MQVARASYRSVGCPMPKQKDRCSLDAWKHFDISLSPVGNQPFASIYLYP